VLGLVAAFLPRPLRYERSMTAPGARGPSRARSGSRRLVRWCPGAACARAGRLDRSEACAPLSPRDPHSRKCALRVGAPAPRPSTGVGFVRGRAPAPTPRACVWGTCGNVAQYALRVPRACPVPLHFLSLMAPLFQVRTLDAQGVICHFFRRGVGLPRVPRGYSVAPSVSQSSPSL
jgi:hypothetical protein